MLVSSGVTVGLVVVALGSIAVSRPTSAQNSSNGNFGALAAIGAGSTTGMFRQAPIGHRQPRPIDIPAAELSPSDRALRQEDQTGRRYPTEWRSFPVHSLAEAAVQTIPANPVAPWRLAKGGPARASGTTSPPRQSHRKR